MATVLHEVFAHRHRSIGRHELQPSRRVRFANDDHAVIDGSGDSQSLNHFRDGRVSLPNRTVDANHARIDLIKNRVQRDGCLSRLAITNNQLPLASADRY